MSRKARFSEGWSAAFLLVGMVLTSSLTLAATEWTDHLEAVPLAGLVGLVAGILLSLSTFHAWLSHVLSTVYGLAWVGFLLGRALPGELTWRERIFDLGTRVAIWVQRALAGETSQDALIFLLFLGVLFWVLGYGAAWNTYRRRRVWITAVSMGVASVVAVHFYIGDAPLAQYLIIYLLVALLYVGRAQTFVQQDAWRRERVAFDPRLGLDVLQSSLLLAVFVLGVAWMLPSTSSASTSVSEAWERINSPWETVEEEWQRLFSSIHSGEREIAEPFGSSLALGGPSRLKDTLVLDIAAQPSGRYYWRAGIYAAYDGSEWAQPEGDVVALLAGQEAIAVTNDASRRQVTQRVTNYLPGRRLIVGASQLTAVDRAAEALARVEDGTPLAYHRVASLEPLEAGEPYSVTSSVSDADAGGLRRAGRGYPTWITERYLQLPSTLPERVRTLAQRITDQKVAGGVASPYDKARLLEQYLRSTITYNLDPPPAPADRDYVDFLLFESEQAYCNGYATAMVVMARSLGIPARLATGYAEGSYDEERQIFRVRENNAHAWPEIYFPGYGWVEFEPTAGQDPLIRPDPDPAAASADDPPAATERDLADDLRTDFERSFPIPEDGLEATAGTDRPAEVSSRELPRIWPWLGGALLLTVTVTGARWAMENLGLRRLPASEKAFARLLRFGRWIGRPLRAPDTPLEWAQALGVLLPEAEEPIIGITGIYVRAKFGRGDARDPAAEIAWQQIRAPLWRRLLWGQWRARLGPAPTAQ